MVVLSLYRITSSGGKCALRGTASLIHGSSPVASREKEHCFPLMRLLGNIISKHKRHRKVVNGARYGGPFLFCLLTYFLYSRTIALVQKSSDVDLSKSFRTHFVGTSFSTGRYLLPNEVLTKIILGVTFLCAYALFELCHDHYIKDHILTKRS